MATGHAIGTCRQIVLTLYVEPVSGGNPILQSCLLCNQNADTKPCGPVLNNFVSFCGGLGFISLSGDRLS